MNRTWPVRASVSWAVAWLAIALLLSWSTPLYAEGGNRTNFNVPAGRLSDTLLVLGKQANIFVGVFDRSGLDTSTRPVRGRLTLDEALRRLLSGTRYTYRKTRTGDVILVRSAPLVKVKRTRAEPVRPPPAAPAPAEPIVVTATKSGYSLADYPGSVAVVDFDADLVASSPARGTGMLIEHLPILGSTSLGPGRNKLFARGIADSSFNGQSQANVAMYLGDVRLNYSGPDPDLALVDVDRVEVLVGPYGTLYGSGALGGVVRVQPHVPELDRASGHIDAEISDVRKGGTGSSLTAIGNIPVVHDRAAVRVVGYRTVDAGYIDNRIRGLKDTNRVTTTGARILARLEPGAGTTVDLGLVFQHINGRDSQYVTDAAGDLESMSIHAQPYSMDYLSPSLIVRQSIGELQLVSATNWTRHRTRDTFDFAGFASDVDNKRFRMFSHETRLSGELGGVRMVAGFNYVNNAVREAFSIVSRPPFSLPPFRLDQSSRTNDTSLYGEASFPLLPGLTAGIGARINQIRSTHSTLVVDIGRRAEGRLSHWSALPSASLSWKPQSDMLFFLAYRTGMRSGSLYVFPGSSYEGPLTYEAQADRLSTIEIGARYTPLSSLRLAANFSYSRWNNVQADFPDGAGITSTVNFGDTRIWGLDMSAAWQPTERMAIDAAVFVNNGPKYTDIAEFDFRIPEPAIGLRLPNVAKSGARATALYQIPLTGNLLLKLGGSLRYYGPVNTEFGRRQAGYAEAGMSGQLEFGRCVVSLGITNITNVRGNRFSIGNSRVALHFNERQVTPLQPRTIHLGVGVDF